MSRKLWQCTAKKKSDRSYCKILKITGTVLAVAGVACLLVYFFTFNSDVALLGLSSLASAATGLVMAGYVQK
jgi:uncharacterized membrane protein SirB2